MTNVNSLPPEIMASIFQRLYVDFDLHSDRSIFNAMRVCHLWRDHGADIGFFSSDGKVWKFSDEFCEMRRVLEYDEREVQLDPAYFSRLSESGSWQGIKYEVLAGIGEAASWFYEVTESQ